jgi:hypothetical protein
MFEERRMYMNFEAAWDDAISNRSVCTRCRELDLVGVLNAYPPWTTQEQLTQAFRDGHSLIRSLGETGSVEFWEDCSACRCLFALTPNPSSADQEVLLIPDWTVCRISGETGIDLDTALERHYSTCLVVVLKPSTLESIEFPV